MRYQLHSPLRIGQSKVCRCGAEDYFKITKKTECGKNSLTTCPNFQVLKSGGLLLSFKGK
ncbi:hypothetical protein U9M48_016809 [Paspalum notatum var. saurae]|uniref:Uncharacterized protein n=1 Tax=Paspalum notatum var. saurae TaxID=547442 RepID=A0AAQ3T7E8_PASNO